VIRANIVQPSSIKASIPACHFNAMCSAFNSVVMDSPASSSVTSDSGVAAKRTSPLELSFDVKKNRGHSILLVI
jgi:hypothetical protein